MFWSLSSDNFRIIYIWGRAWGGRGIRSFARIWEVTPIAASAEVVILKFPHFMGATNFFKTKEKNENISREMQFNFTTSVKVEK